MKCQYCGKEYIKNSADLSYMPEFMQEKLKYIPACNCLEKLHEQEMEALRKKQDEESRMNRVKKFMDISVVDAKFFKSTFENADMSSKHMRTAERYAKSFLTKNQNVGMLLYGGVGTGKTYATACIANYLREHGKSVFVMNLGLYFNKLKIEWEKEEKAVLENVKKCDLLIIDDFGAEMTSNTENVTWRDEKIFNLIDTAYRSEKPLIISTNLRYHEDLSKCEIEKNLGSRIRDRVVDMCYPIAVIGKSRRGINKETFWESIA